MFYRLHARPFKQIETNANTLITQRPSHNPGSWCSLHYTIDTPSRCCSVVGIPVLGLIWAHASHGICVYFGLRQSVIQEYNVLINKMYYAALPTDSMIHKHKSFYATRTQPLHQNRPIIRHPYKLPTYNHYPLYLLLSTPIDVHPSSSFSFHTPIPPYRNSFPRLPPPPSPIVLVTLIGHSH